MAEILHARV